MYTMKVEVMAGLTARVRVKVHQVKVHQVAFTGCDLQVLTLMPIASLSPFPSKKTYEKKFLISQMLEKSKSALLVAVCDLEVGFF